MVFTLDDAVLAAFVIFSAFLSAVLNHFSLPVYSIPSKESRPDIKIPPTKDIVYAIQNDDSFSSYRSEQLIDNVSRIYCYLDRCNIKEKQYGKMMDDGTIPSLLFSCLFFVFFSRKTSIIWGVIYGAALAFFQFFLIPKALCKTDFFTHAFYKEKEPTRKEETPYPKHITVELLQSYMELEQNRFCIYGDIRNRAIERFLDASKVA